MTALDQLAEIVFSQENQVELRVRQKALACIKDWVAAYTLGIESANYPVVRDAFQMDDCDAYDSTRQSIFVRGSMDRAMWMGIVGHLAHFNDVEFTGNTSPTSVLLPAVLAVPSNRQQTLADLVSPMTAGYAVIHHLGRLLNPLHFDIGWNAASTIGCIGAAAAVARSLGLDRRKILAAMALAANQMAGLKSSNGTIAKPLSVGHAACAAIRAAQLAAAGATGHSDLFERAGGIFTMFGGDATNSIEPASTMAGLDSIVFKEFPCYFGVHQPVRLARDLASVLGRSSIERVSITASAYTMRQMSLRCPRDWSMGQFSVAHCVAVALCAGPNVITSLSDQSIGREDVQAVERNTLLRADGGFSKFEALVDVVTSDGRTHQAHGVLDLDSLRAPIVAEEKLQAVLAARIPEARAKIFVDGAGFETMAVSELLQRLSEFTPSVYQGDHSAKLEATIDGR
jgi:2-methylcitrate dehydratase PrpD